MDEFDQEDYFDEFEMQFSQELEILKEVGEFMRFLKARSTENK